MRHPVGSGLGMYPLKVFTPRSPLCDRTSLTIIKNDLTCWKRITTGRPRLYYPATRSWRAGAEDGCGGTRIYGILPRRYEEISTKYSRDSGPMLTSGGLLEDRYRIVAEVLGNLMAAHVCPFLAHHTMQISIMYRLHSVDLIGVDWWRCSTSPNI